MPDLHSVEQRCLVGDPQIGSLPMVDLMAQLMLSDLTQQVDQLPALIFPPP